MTRIRHHTTDILVTGSGGAGLRGARHAKAGAPDRRGTRAVEGPPGKTGCNPDEQGRQHRRLIYT